MGRPTSKACSEYHCCPGRCHARTVFQWRGDFDFRLDNDITTFPDYRFALLESQPKPTGMLWRIRYDQSSVQWLDYLIDNDLAMHISGTEVTSDLNTTTTPWQSQPPPGVGGSWDSIPNSGPLRDGIVIGAFLFASRFILPGTEPIPWALDIGCVRCGYNHKVVSWPAFWRCKYTKSPDVPNSAVSTWHKTPEWRVLEWERVPGQCLNIDPGDTYRLYWAGSPSQCVPDNIIWHNLGASQFGGTGLSPASGNTAEFRGWASNSGGGVAPGPDTLAGFDVDRTDFIELTGKYTATVDPPAVHYQALSDWLDLGGKTLFLTAPHAAGPSPGSPNVLLAALGSSMTLGPRPHVPGQPVNPSSRNDVNEYWETTDHALSGFVDRYYRREWHANSTNHTDQYTVGTISGGVPLTNAVFGTWSFIPPVVFSEITRMPIVSVDTLASGSRIILTAVYDGLVKTNGTFVTMEAPMLPRFITNAMAGV
jgi:hypothetical protein